jgi:hypothetical protein
LRSARPRRASRRPAPRGPHSPAPRPRPRCRSRPREIRPRPPLSRWPHPRHSEAGAVRRGGAATATGRTGSGARLSVRRPCAEPTPRSGAGVWILKTMAEPAHSAIMRRQHGRGPPVIVEVARP